VALKRGVDAGATVAAISPDPPDEVSVKAFRAASSLHASPCIIAAEACDGLGRVSEHSRAASLEITSPAVMV